jgi:hypothetical protein
LSASRDPVRELFEQREREFLLAKARVKIRASVENIEAGDYGIESLTEGQSVELPRWVAEELAELNIAEIPDEPFETEVFRALSKEKMMGPLQLSTLPENFYVRMRRRVRHLEDAADEGKVRRDEFEKLRTVCYDLVGMRLSKLLSLSSTSAKPSDLGEKLTPEERAFFGQAQALSAGWRSALLGGMK